MGLFDLLLCAGVVIIGYFFITMFGINLPTSPIDNIFMLGGFIIGLYFLSWMVKNT